MRGCERRQERADTREQDPGREHALPADLRRHHRPCDLEHNVAVEEGRQHGALLFSVPLELAVHRHHRRSGRRHLRSGRNADAQPVDEEQPGEEEGRGDVPRRATTAHCRPGLNSITRSSRAATLHVVDDVVPPVARDVAVAVWARMERGSSRALLGATALRARALACEHRARGNTQSRYLLIAPSRPLGLDLEVQYSSTFFLLLFFPLVISIALLTVQLVPTSR